MERRGWLIVVAGLIGVCAASFWLIRSSQRQSETVQVLVARSEVRAGTYLAAPEKFFDSRVYPKADVQPDAISDMDELREKVVLRKIAMGQPARRIHVMQGESPPLPFNLPPGHYAVTLRAKIEAELSGFVVPGSRVSLIYFVPDPKDPKKVMARMLLENLVVLHYQGASPEETRYPPPVSAILTVSVKAEELTKLATVSGDRELMVVLEKPDEP
jgi:Flp pilus assembly protein CpaB